MAWLEAASVGNGQQAATAIAIAAGQGGAAGSEQQVATAIAMAVGQGGAAGGRHTETHPIHHI